MSAAHTPEPDDVRALAYIRRIRNEHKRAYAQAYAEWLYSDRQTDPPERGALGCMGAQAVRMELHAIVGVQP